MEFKPYTNNKVPDYKVRPKTAGRVRSEDVRTFPFNAAGVDYTIMLTKSPQREGAFFVNVYEGSRYVGAIKGWVYSEKQGIDEALRIINGDTKRRIYKESSEYKDITSITEAKRLLENYLLGNSNDEVHGIGIFRTETDNTEYIQIAVKSEKGVDYVKDLFPDNKFRGYTLKVVVQQPSIAQSGVDGNISISVNKDKAKKIGKYLLIAGGIGVLVWMVRNSMSQPIDLGAQGGIL